MVMYTSFAVFALLTLALIVVSGYSLGASMLLLGSVVLLWKRPKLGLKKDDYLFIAALFLYFAATSASNLYHLDQLRDYDGPLRFLLAIPALLLLLAYPAQPVAVWGGLAFGAISSGIYGTWQHVVMGLERSGGNTNAIQYSNICILLGLLCLAGLEWAQTQQRKILWTLLLALGCFWGLLGSIMSGSRGSWVVVPFCALVLARHHARMYGKRYFYMGLLLLFALMAAVYVIPQSGVKTRSDMAVLEAQEYLVNYQAHNTETSVGARLEMWSTALDMVPEHPWLGWGQQGYMNNKIALSKEGRLAPSIVEHYHAHNEYLDALVKHGAIGLLALLGLYLMPLLLFLGKLKQNLPSVRPYALAGVLLMTSYLAFGLTTAFMTVNHGVMMLAFLLIILWSCVRAQERASLPP